MSRRKKAFYSTVQLQHFFFQQLSPLFFGGDFLVFFWGGGGVGDTDQVGLEYSQFCLPERTDILGNTFRSQETGLYCKPTTAMDVTRDGLPLLLCMQSRLYQEVQRRIT